VGRYAYGILGLLLLVGAGSGGYLSYEAKQHNSTIKWEYQRLTQHVLPNILSGGESTRQTKARLKTDLTTLSTETTTALDKILAHSNKVSDDNGTPRPTRQNWLTNP